MQLKFVFFLASTIVTVLGNVTISQCFADLQEIQERVQILNSAIWNFDRTNLVDAWNLHLSAGKAQVAVEHVTACAEIVTVNAPEADSLKALGFVRIIVKLTLEGLTGLQHLKPEIDKIKIPGCKAVIKRDLEGLKTSSFLLQILAEKIPYISTEAAQHKESVDQAFEKTVELFS